MTVPLETTDDAFLGGRLMLLQPKRGYRAGIDAVFLAATAAIMPGKPCRVLDIGAGVGTVGLCIAVRCPEAEIVLLEREPGLAALASDNCVRNGFDCRVTTIEAAIGATSAVLHAADLSIGGFDHVLANPPYHIHGQGHEAPDALKAVSHAMPPGSLDDWARFMARMVKSGGTATMVHKADALPAVLAAFTRRFGDIRILPLHPRKGEPAVRILVQGTRGSRAPLTLLAGLLLHDDGASLEDGPTGRAGVTPAADAVLRQGAGLLMEEP